MTTRTELLHFFAHDGDLCREFWNVCEVGDVKNAKIGIPWDGCVLFREGGCVQGSELKHCSRVRGSFAFCSLFSLLSLLCRGKTYVDLALYFSTSQCLCIRYCGPGKSKERTSRRARLGKRVVYSSPFHPSFYLQLIKSSTGSFTRNYASLLSGSSSSRSAERRRTKRVEG